MSKIYDALKKLEAERRGTSETNGGKGNGGNGGDGRRFAWRRFFTGRPRPRTEGRPALHLDLGPDVEEAYQRLGTNLLVGSGVEPAQQPPRVLGMTASRHGEGTTTTAAVFGTILVRRRGGRVAVVEANLRTPSFDTVFNVRRNGGFADLVLGEKPLSEVMQPTEIPNLFAVGCGQTPLGASSLFDSPGVGAALDQLRKHFDFVIFDLPPVMLYADASILGPRLDTMLIVIEADRTRIPEVERTRRGLERAGVKIAGSVLNRRRNYIPAFLEDIL
jgi:capsular exopolysaccharide synthesis family protein